MTGLLCQTVGLHRVYLRAAHLTLTLTLTLTLRRRGLGGRGVVVRCGLAERGEMRVWRVSQVAHPPLFELHLGLHPLRRGGEPTKARCLQTRAACSFHAQDEVVIPECNMPACAAQNTLRQALRVEQVRRGAGWAPV